MYLATADENGFFLLLVLPASTSSPSMSIWYTRSCGWNGDFHRKIPGVEVNVVRIQIDILFPLFSSPLCAAEPSPLFSRTGSERHPRWYETRKIWTPSSSCSSFCYKREIQSAVPTSVLWDSNCFLKRPKIDVRKAWSLFDSLGMIFDDDYEQRTFIDVRLGFKATFACINLMNSLRRNFLWWLYS